MKRFTVSLLLILTTIGFLSTKPMDRIAGATSFQAGDGARRISPADLRQLVKKGAAIIVDVRGQDAYKAGHIKGAKLIPASEIASRAGELPRNKLIATYCS